MRKICWKIKFRKQRKCLLILLSFFLLPFFLCSCVTQRNCTLEGDLCGLVVDENNRPIPGFNIYCKNDGLFNQSATTNNSGIFVFSNVKIGTYYLYGEKDNYLKLVEKDFSFNDCTSFYCFQICSLKGCLSEIKVCIGREDFEKSLDLLSNIVVRKNSYGESLVLAYKAYVNYKIGNTEEVNNCITKFKESGIKPSQSILQTMEKIAYE